MWFVSGQRHLELFKRYEQVQAQFAQAQALILKQQVLLEEAIKRYDELVTRTLDLKREGFHPGPAPVEFPKRQEMPTEIEQAVMMRGGQDQQLIARLYRSAALRLQAGEAPELIAKRILSGSRINPFAL